MGSECCRSTESSHVTLLTLFFSTPGPSLFDSSFGLLENFPSSLGLDVSELGLVITGVGGGVRREETVAEVGEDVMAKVTAGVRREELEAVVATGWLPVIEEEELEAVAIEL